MTATTAQKIIAAPIVAMQQRTSKKGNAYFVCTLAGLAQDVTIFADDAAAIKKAWPTFDRNEAGQVLVPLVVTVKKDADRVIEGVTIPGFTNYTAKLANVTSDACPF